MVKGYDGGSFSGGFMSRTSNKKIKRSMRDSIELWTEYFSENGTYEHYIAVCNRAVGLGKNLGLMGTASLTANQMKGDV